VEAVSLTDTVTEAPGQSYKTPLRVIAAFGKGITDTEVEAVAVHPPKEDTTTLYVPPSVLVIFVITRNRTRLRLQKG
jgi:hypothetical protein